MKDTSVFVTCAVAVPALIGAGLSHAAPPQDFLTTVAVSDGNPATNDLGRANTTINTVPFKRNSLTSAGGYQFVSYYGEDGKLLVGRRKLSAPASAPWTILRTQFTSYNINDAHNTSSIALDGDGYLHVSWGMHGGGPLLYTRSTASVLNDNAFHLAGEAQGNAGRLANQIPLQERSNLTYPEFYSIPGTGDLLFTFRTGGSGNGDYHMARWNNTTNAWSPVHASLSPYDPWIARDNATDANRDANAYPNQLIFDSSGKLHATWTWRAGGGGPPGSFADFQSNHHINYAASSNNGVTWKKSDGTIYQRNGAHVIDEANAEIAVQLPEGSSLINTAGMAVGPDDTPYVASWWAPGTTQGNFRRQYMLAWLDDGQWKTSQIGNRTIDPIETRKPEGNVSDLARPIVVVDESNRVIVAYRDNDGANGLTIAFSENSSRGDWRFIELTADDLGKYEPTFDLARWQSDGVLSFYYQPNGLDANGSPVSVLEWDTRRYFASVPEPGSAGAMLLLTGGALLHRPRP